MSNADKAEAVKGQTPNLCQHHQANAQQKNNLKTKFDLISVSPADHNKLSARGWVLTNLSDWAFSLFVVENSSAELP